jgi:hypothetical protein
MSPKVKLLPQIQGKGTVFPLKCYMQRGHELLTTVPSCDTQEFS